MNVVIWLKAQGSKAQGFWFVADLEIAKVRYSKGILMGYDIR
ncbi:MAG: hypothetical protein WEA99_12185 [Brumimicrobium sp.]